MAFVQWCHVNEKKILNNILQKWSAWNGVLLCLFVGIDLSSQCPVIVLSIQNYFQIDENLLLKNSFKYNCCDSFVSLLVFYLSKLISGNTIHSGLTDWLTVLLLLTYKERPFFGTFLELFRIFLEHISSSQTQGSMTTS